MRTMIRSLRPSVVHIPDAGLRLEPGQTRAVEVLTPQIEALLAAGALQVVPVAVAPRPAAVEPEPVAPSVVEETPVAPPSADSEPVAPAMEPAADMPGADEDAPVGPTPAEPTMAPAADDEGPTVLAAAEPEPATDTPVGPTANEPAPDARAPGKRGSKAAAPSLALPSEAADDTC
jgi:hypothetical protein